MAAGGVNGLLAMRGLYGLHGQVVEVGVMANEDRVNGSSCPLPAGFEGGYRYRFAACGENEGGSGETLSPGEASSVTSARGLAGPGRFATLGSDRTRIGRSRPYAPSDGPPTLRRSRGQAQRGAPRSIHTRTIVAAALGVPGEEARGGGRAGQRRGPRV